VPMYSALSKFFYVTNTLMTDPQLTSSQSSPKIQLTFNILRICKLLSPKRFHNTKILHVFLFG